MTECRGGRPTLARRRFGGTSMVRKGCGWHPQRSRVAVVVLTPDQSRGQDQSDNPLKFRPDHSMGAGQMDKNKQNNRCLTPLSGGDL